MTEPELSDDDGIAQYRAGLRAAGRKQRLGGFLAVVVGAVLVMLSPYAGGAGEAIRMAGFAVVALGWALILAGYFLRTRYQRRRLAELD